MKITPQLQRVDRLVFRRDAEQAGIATGAVRPLHRHWIEAGTVGRVVADDLWFETIVDDSWVVAYRIVAQPEGLAVAEVRVFPLAGRIRPGEWAGALQGTRATAPAGGITSRLMRRVRVNRSVWYGREVLLALAKARGRIESARHPGQGRLYVAHVLSRAGVTTVHPIEGRGRKRLPDREYEQTAREYLRLLLATKRPGRLYQLLALRLSVSEAQAINRVARAKKYGFLRDIPARGRSGP